MKITWGTYPNNIGHANFRVCFRCHDGNHTSASDNSITQDCSACHNILAVEEGSPKILSDLGISETDTLNQIETHDSRMSSSTLPFRRSKAE